MEEGGGVAKSGSKRNEGIEKREERERKRYFPQESPGGALKRRRSLLVHTMATGARAVVITPSMK